MNFAGSFKWTEEHLNQAPPHTLIFSWKACPVAPGKHETFFGDRRSLVPSSWLDSPGGRDPKPSSGEVRMGSLAQLAQAALHDLPGLEKFKGVSD